MKKLILLGIIALLSSNAYAQRGAIAFGPEIAFGTQAKDLGIGIRGNYRVTDEVRFAPSMVFFSKNKGLSGLEISADVHYLFPLGRFTSVYPLCGLLLTNWHTDGYKDSFSGFEVAGVSSTKIGCNLGGGIEYQLMQNLIAGLDLKYSIVARYDQFVPAIKLMYRINK